MITAWSASCFGQLPQPLAALLVFCGRCGEFAHLREWLDERRGPAQLWDAAEASQAYLSPWHEYAQALGGEYSRRVHHVIQFNSTLRFTILVHELSVNMKRSFFAIWQVSIWHVSISSGDNRTWLSCILKMSWLKICRFATHCPNNSYSSTWRLVVKQKSRHVVYPRIEYFQWSPRWHFWS